MENGAEMKSTTKKKTNGNAAGQPGSVGQIRDILFGQQMSDYEERFAELEKQVENRFTELQASLQESVDELKALVANEASGINERNVSRDQLADQLAAIADSIRDSKGG